jgi:hypothetical protein
VIKPHIGNTKQQKCLGSNTVAIFFEPQSSSSSSNNNNTINTTTTTTTTTNINLWTNGNGASDEYIDNMSRPLRNKALRKIKAQQTGVNWWGGAKEERRLLKQYGKPKQQHQQHQQQQQHQPTIAVSKDQSKSKPRVPPPAAAAAAPPSTRKKAPTTKQQPQANLSVPTMLLTMLHTQPAPKVDQHNDDCSVCGFGGNVLCCDHCNLVYHGKCLATHARPDEDDSIEWACPMCTNEQQVVQVVQAVPVRVVGKKKRKRGGKGCGCGCVGDKDMHRAIQASLQLSSSSSSSYKRRK